MFTKEKQSWRRKEIQNRLREGTEKVRNDRTVKIKYRKNLKRTN